MAPWKPRAPPPRRNKPPTPKLARPTPAGGPMRSSHAPAADACVWACTHTSSADHRHGPFHAIAEARRCLRSLVPWPSHRPTGSTSGKSARCFAGGRWYASRASGRASKPPLLRPAGAGLCWQGLAFAPARRDARSAAAGAHAGSRASMRSGRGHRRQDDLAGVALLQFDQIVDVLDNPRGSGICRSVRLHRGLPVRHRDKPGPGLDELIGLKSRPPAKDLQQPPGAST